MTDNQIINLFISGNFTIVFHNRGSCCLYKGKHKYEKLPEKEDASFDMSDGHNGYAPEIMVLLVKALNGKIDSI
jgi:hypothetical protein